MTPNAQWFHNQLQSSADAFTWAVEQVPIERRTITPLPRFGEWSVARHVFHMVYYEQHVALALMRQWFDPSPLTIAPNDEDADWTTAPSLDDLLVQFQRGRAAQIEMVDCCELEQWNIVRDTENWGPVSFQWFMGKTFQHTLDHTNAVLNIALFWDPWLFRFGSEQDTTH